MELCSESLWQDLCRKDPTCTFYQTRPWHSLAARHYRAESIPLLFRFKDAQACLPLLKDRRWGRDRYFSPFGTYTALVCSQALDAEQLKRVASALGGLNLHLISSPFTPNAVTVGKILPSKTQVIDLASLDPENPMRDWGADHRRRTLLAHRNGVTVRMAESEKDWERYYELYQLSLQRWGGKATQAYPKALFENLRAHLAETPSMRLWLAEHNGEIGAGYLTFYHNRHVANWHGAADPRFFKLGAAQALLFFMIRDARQRDFKLFDLAGSSGLSGVDYFKSQFGGRTLEFESCLNRPGILGFLAERRDALRAAIRGRIRGTR